MAAIHVLDLDLCYLRYPPPEALQRDMAREIVNLNRYPSGTYETLKRAFAEYAGIDAGGVTVGNGLDEVIDLVTRVWGGDILVAVPTFSQFELAAARAGSRCTLVDCMTGGRYEVRYPHQSVRRASLIWVCTPNNPTGGTTSRQTIVELLEQCPGIVAVDECYYEFCQESVVDLVARYDNLVVLRSFSKSFGIAALRLGFAVSQHKNIEALESIRQIFNVNRFAEVAGTLVLEHVDQYRQLWRRVAAVRDFFITALRQMGYNVFDSKTNFVLVDFSDAERAGQVWRALLQNGIRTFPGWSEEFTGLGSAFIRFTVGLREEMERVLEVMRNCAPKATSEKGKPF